MTVNATKRVLVFNPNTNLSINESIVPIISKLNLKAVHFEFWTCPSTGLSIIKSEQDLYQSTIECFPLLSKLADGFDAFLGACYADHPLIPLLQTYVGNKPVVGIFDASVKAALRSIAKNSKFGIITTGTAFESLLSAGVARILYDIESTKPDDSHKFAQVVASGIDTDDLLPEHRDIARAKIWTATSRLLKNNDIEAICVGGVILVGMEGWVREACVESLGEEKARKIKIIDQIAAGALTVDGRLRQEASYNFSAAIH